jgi:adenosyl cobinamide kinase/adenosyl cobinamide phosphate guanylyltransferase
MAKTQTSDKAKEANRRRVAKHREKQKQQATLQSLLPTSNLATQALGGFASQVQNKVANKVSTTMVNGLSDLIRPSSSMLSDKPFERNYVRGALCTFGGMVAGYYVGSVLHRFVYAGVENQDDTLAKFRLYGLGAGAALGGGAWYLNEEKQRAELQVSSMLADSIPALETPVTLGQMNTMHFEKVIFAPEFHDFFGDNANKHDVLVVHGRAGSAKSHYATKLLASLQQGGKALYISTEENLSDRIRERLSRYNANGVYYVRAHSANDILSYVQNFQPKYLALDSLSNLGLSNDEEKALMKALKRMVDFLVIILHATKDGNYRGSSSILHEADLEVMLDNGIATTGKNRLNGKGEMNLFPQTGNVFTISQPLQKQGMMK